MNSGGAQIHQTGNPHLIGIRMKGKGKGASAASLAGSLLAMLPGAAIGVPGFGGMLERLRGQMAGMGNQPNPKSVLAGQVPQATRGNMRLPNVVPGAARPGTDEAPVLVLGEATRNVLQEGGAAIHVDGPSPSDATPSAIQPGGHGAPNAGGGQPSTLAGSEAKAQAAGQIPEQQTARQLPAGSGRPARGGRTTGPTGQRVRGSISGPAKAAKVRRGPASNHPPENPQAGRPAGPVSVSRGSASKGRPESARAAKPSGLKEAKGRSPQNRRAGISDNRLLRAEADHRPTLARSTAGLRNTWSRAKAAPTHTTGQPLEGRRPVSRENIITAASQSSGRVTGGNTGAKPEGVGRARQPGQPTAAQPHKAAGGRTPADVHAVVERNMNQQRLDGTQSVSNRVATHASQPVSGQDAPVEPSARRQVRLRPSRVRSAVPAEKAGKAQRGATGRRGSEVSHSLTKQDGLRPTSSLTDGDNRGLMKNEMVGLIRSGEARGEDSPAPQAAIPASPAPTAHTETASLATLARQTVLHYGRYVSGEQRNNVFAFDGGSLGKVQITFQENHAGTTLHIVVDSPEARQMLQRALPNLAQQWAQEGLDFSDVDVTVEDSGGEQASSDGGGTAQESTESSEAMDEIVNEDIKSSGVRYYGYNTVEFVA